MKICFSCKKEVSAGTRPGRGESCPSCGADLKACLNCRFYERGVYNDCREPSAERVVDKAKANFCDFFEFSDSAGALDAKKEDPMEKLKALFKE